MFQSRRFFIPCLIFCFLCLSFSAYAAISRNPLEKKQDDSWQPSNRLSYGSDIRFQSHNSAYTAYFMDSRLILAGFTERSREQEYFEIQIQMQNSQKDAEITTLNPMLSGNDAWLTSLPDYARIKYANIYPRIDMLWSGDQGQLKMQFVIAPGGDPRKIQLQMLGADQIHMTPEGSLQLVTGQKLIEIPRPVAYQSADESGAKSVVQSRYVIKNKNIVSLELGPYDSKRTIVIVP